VAAVLRQHRPALVGFDDPLDPVRSPPRLQGLPALLQVSGCLARAEQLPVPLVPGAGARWASRDGPGTANNFSDKAAEKTVLRAAGVPCARHKLAVGAADLRICRTVGFPLVVKPPAGPGPRDLPSRTTTPDLRSGSIPGCRPLRTVPRQSRSSSPARGAPRQRLVRRAASGLVSNYLSDPLDCCAPVDAVGGAAAARHWGPITRPSGRSRPALKALGSLPG